MINELCNEAYESACAKGQYVVDYDNATLLALIHSEVSEALEADRIGDNDGFKEELADICIRVFSLCGLRDIDLEKEILSKMETNKSRPYMHGKRY